MAAPEYGAPFQGGAGGANMLGREALTVAALANPPFSLTLLMLVILKGSKSPKSIQKESGCRCRYSSRAAFSSAPESTSTVPVRVTLESSMPCTIFGHKQLGHSACARGISEGLRPAQQPKTCSMPQCQAFGVVLPVMVWPENGSYRLFSQCCDDVSCHCQ